MHDILNDLRYTFRNLGQRPGFAAVAIFTLALGIGANSAIFSVVNGVLLKPLGYPSPGELVLLTTQFPNQGFDKFWVSPPEYLELEAWNRSFSSLGAYVTGEVNVSDSESPIRARAGYVTAELFETLGVAAARGRVFNEDEDAPGAANVAVLSSELWRRAFGGDPELLGGELEINGVRTTIVGIMPPGFDVHDEGAELWLPLGLDPANPGGRGSHYLYLIGRLKPGVGIGEARAELESLYAQWKEAFPGEHSHVPNPESHPINVDPLHDEVVGDVEPALLMLWAAVGFVLLIACANVANLLLVRAESRQKEIAIRTAIGAGRGRLLRQFLTEGVVLALLGGVLGLVLASIGVPALFAAHPESLPRVGEIRLDLTAIGFTLGVAVLTGLLFGLAPIVHLSHRSMNLALKDGGQNATAGSGRHRLRRALVVLEMAMAVVLVMLCGFMLRSFWNLLRVDVGFEPAGITTFQLSLPRAQYEESEAVTAFYDRLVTRLAALPGVESAAAMSGLPPKRRINANDTEFEGLQRTADGPVHNTDYWQFVTPEYFATLGIRLAAGELLDRGDVAGSPPVVVVNEALARVFYPDLPLSQVLGRRLRPGWGEYPWLEIIGVVEDVKQGGIDQPAGTELYFPYAQAPETLPFTPRTMHLVVRSELPIESLGTTLRAEVRALDPSLPLAHLRTMDEVLHGAVARPRFLALLLGIFATVALVLAAVGTYGVLSFAVAERRQEIGIRMALGAARGTVLGLVLGQGMRVAAVGLALGIAGSLALTRVAGSLFFGVSPNDPLTFLGVPLLLAVVALLACYLPARRATRVDPVVVLRYE